MSTQVKRLISRYAAQIFFSNLTLCLTGMDACGGSQYRARELETPEHKVHGSKNYPTRVAIVAMANKLARTVWAIAPHDRKYDKNHISIRLF